MLITPDRIRTLQRKLYCKAKQEPGFRFYSLYDKVYRADILSHAFHLVWANKGAPGIDGVYSDALDTTTARKLMDGFTELDEMLRNNPESSDTIKQVDGRLKELCRKIDTIRDKCVWPDALKKMLEALNAYEQAVAEGKGDSQKLEEFRKKVASARQQERPQVAQQITAEIGTAIVQDDPTDAILACFLHYFQNVNTLQWSNKMAAQQKINEGAAILEQIIPLGKESPAFRDAVLQKLLPIVQELSRLLEREGVTPPEPGDPTGLLVGLLK